MGEKLLGACAVAIAVPLLKAIASPYTRTYLQENALISCTESRKKVTFYSVFTTTK